MDITDIAINKPVKKYNPWNVFAKIPKISARINATKSKIISCFI